MHLDAVYRASLRLTRNEDAARDLVQDAMLRAYRAFDTYTSGTNARAWLFSIVYSVFINGYHRARRRPQTESIDEVEARYAEVLRAPAVARAAADQWTEPEVLRALDELPEEFRATVLLVDVEELTYEEAAQALGCAIGTVRSRVFRARRLLGASLLAFAQQRGFAPAKVEKQ